VEGQLVRRTRRSITAARALVAAAALIASEPDVAWSWGCEGHWIVARIAEWHLTPTARRKAAELLAQNKIDPHLERVCPAGGRDTFVDGATWADDVRVVRPSTSDWHFLDIPRDAPQDQGATFCGSAGCVTKAIDTQLGVLRSSQPGSKRAEALRYVVHFVGDVHQPMHDVTNGDRGGNCVPVTYLLRAPQLQENGKYSPNLHQMWDTSIIRTELSERMFTVGELASAINCRFDSQIDAWMKEPPSPMTWAWEGHQKAAEVAYGKLAPSVPVQEPVKLASCSVGHVSQHMLALGLVADRKYEDAALAVIEEQLAKAGARLAAELNAVWP
jgi:hypothetical protein